MRQVALETTMLKFLFPGRDTTTTGGFDTSAGMGSVETDRPPTHYAMFEGMEGWGGGILIYDCAVAEKLI